MDHAEEVIQGVLSSHYQPAETLDSGKQPFDLPPAAIPPERPAILSAPFTPAVVWRIHLHARFRQLVIEPVRVVGVVSNQALQGFGHDDLGQRPLNQRHFVRRSAFRANGERKTSAVRHCHDLGPLATHGFPNARAPCWRERTSRR